MLMVLTYWEGLYNMSVHFLASVAFTASSTWQAPSEPCLQSAWAPKMWQPHQIAP